MTAEELLLDETHAWLGRARSDLRAAQVLRDAQAYAEALFFCQQAAEKAIKGFLAFHQRPFRKTHELRQLISECLAIDESLETTLGQADDLSKYAWRFRYPGAPYEPDAIEAGEAFAKAEAVLRAIENRLPPPAVP